MADAAAIAQAITLLDEYEHARTIVERLIELEDVEHPRAVRRSTEQYGTQPWPWGGAEWDVIAVPGVDGAYLSRLVAAGLLAASPGRRRRYRLRDRTAAEGALQAPPRALGQTLAPDVPWALPVDLFDVVIGLDWVKTMMRRALLADRPVHPLLVGPPGGGKSELLREVLRLPGASLHAGSLTTKAGLRDHLLAERPRVVVIDDLHTMAPQDTRVLLSVMSDGVLPVTVHGRRYEERMAVWFVAAANHTDGMAPELLSRWLRLPIPPYGDDEWRLLLYGVLSRRHGLDPELAGELATLCAPRTRDVRDVERVAFLTHDRREIAQLVDQLLPR